MFRLPALAALTFLLAAPSAPRVERFAHSTDAAPVRSYPALERIAWTYGDADWNDEPAKLLRFSRDGWHFSIYPDDYPEIVDRVAEASYASPGEVIAFGLTREAGGLDCTGRITAPGQAAGTCRFDPDRGFAAALAQRGPVAEDSDQLLALTLVGAHLAALDGLADQGYRLADADEVIAVASLGVTPDYARELREAGLAISEVDDLIAARSLGLDAEWLAAMASAGYADLTAEQAIRMRALGIDPDYAIRMTRVLSVLGKIE